MPAGATAITVLAATADTRTMLSTPLSKLRMSAASRASDGVAQSISTHADGAAAIAHALGQIIWWHQPEAVRAGTSSRDASSGVAYPIAQTRLRAWTGRRRVDIRALLGSPAFDVRYASNCAAKADIPGLPPRATAAEVVVGR
jgi:hypothetical protein